MKIIDGKIHYEVGDWITWEPNVDPNTNECITFQALRIDEVKDPEGQAVYSAGRRTIHSACLRPATYEEVQETMKVRLTDIMVYKEKRWEKHLIIVINNFKWLVKLEESSIIIGSFKFFHKDLKTLYESMEVLHLASVVLTGGPIVTLTELKKLINELEDLL